MTITALSPKLWPRTRIGARKSLWAIRPAFYICLVSAAVTASYAYWLRTSSIFACQATLYNSDRYIAYCNAASYADYEHGAFWFSLEPSALTFSRNADVLFLGNSHSQFAFSTTATGDWFSAASARYYLLGFANYEGGSFAEKLLRQIRPKARVYVINVDDFFKRWESPPATEVMHDPKARTRYETKQRWQRVHEVVCKTLPSLCSHQYAYYRSRGTGGYELYTGKKARPFTPVSYDLVTSEDVVTRSTAIAVDFLSHLPVQKKCVILTTIPTVETKIANAKAIAAALGEDLVVPEVQGLLTFDGSHLDRGSAERWSQAFFQTAGSKIRSCLQDQEAVPSFGSSPQSIAH